MIRTLVYDAQIAEGVQASAPLSVDINVGNQAMLRQVRYQFPPGPSGKTGWRLKYAGSVILPFQQDDWIIGDNLKEDIPINFIVHSGTLQLEQYNEDRFPHAVLYRFEVEDIELRGAFRSSFIDPALIENAL